MDQHSQCDIQRVTKQLSLAEEGPLAESKQEQSGADEVEMNEVRGGRLNRLPDGMPCKNYSYGCCTLM